jgi:hypothetical protein
MNCTIDVSAGFLNTIIANPAVPWTNNSFVIIRIFNCTELIVQHESGSRDNQVVRKIGEVEIAPGCVGPDRMVE